MQQEENVENYLKGLKYFHLEINIIVQRKDKVGLMLLAYLKEVRECYF